MTKSAVKPVAKHVTDAITLLTEDHKKLNNHRLKLVGLKYGLKVLIRIA